MKVEGTTEAPIAVVYKIKVKEEEEEEKCCDGVFDESSNWSTSLPATTITSIITVPPITTIVSTNTGSSFDNSKINTTETRIITTTTTTPSPTVSQLSSGEICLSSAVVLLPSSSSTTRQSSTVIISTPSTSLTMVNTTSESFSVDLDLATKIPQVLANGASLADEKVSEERDNDENKIATTSKENGDGLCPYSMSETKTHVKQVNGTTTQADYLRGSGPKVQQDASETESRLSSQSIKPENEDSSGCRQQDETQMVNKETTHTLHVSNDGNSGLRCISRIFAGHGKLKRLLGTLIQFATNISHDTGDSVRTLVLGLLSGAMTAEEFHAALQEATRVPLRGFVLPYLRHTLPSLRRDLNSAARSNNQTCVQYLQLNESAVLDTVDVTSSSEPVDFFGHHNNKSNNGTSNTNLTYPCSTNYGMVRSGSATSVCGIQHVNSNSGGNSTLHHHFSNTPTNFATKRRSSDTSFNDNQSSLDDGPIYGSKRASWSSNVWSLSSHQQQQQSQQQFPESYGWYPMHSSGASIHAPSPVPPPGLVQVNQSTSFGPSQPSSQQQQQLGYASMQQNSPSLDDEWKNINVMLNCILGMVDKTKRALAILQRRGSPSPAVPPLTPGSVAAHNGNSNGNSSCTNGSHSGESYPGDRDTNNFKRLSSEFVAQTIRVTEDKVAEVKRRAEEAVQEVKRAAVVEVQRAVTMALAESRANERLRVHRLLDLPLPSQKSPRPRQSSFVRVATHVNPVNSESVSRTPGSCLTTTLSSTSSSSSSSATASNTDEKDVLHMTNVIGSGCWNCGRTALETCGGCGIARYCGYFCQHRDWETGGHHATCNSRPSRDCPRQSTSPTLPTTTTALVNSHDNDSEGASTVTQPK